MIQGVLTGEEIRKVEQQIMEKFVIAFSGKHTNLAIIFYTVNKIVIKQTSVGDCTGVWARAAAVTRK